MATPLWMRNLRTGSYGPGDTMQPKSDLDVSLYPMPYYSSSMITGKDRDPPMPEPNRPHHRKSRHTKHAKPAPPPPPPPRVPDLPMLQETHQPCRSLAPSRQITVTRNAVAGTNPLEPSRRSNTLSLPNIKGLDIRNYTGARGRGVEELTIDENRRDGNAQAEGKSPEEAEIEVSIGTLPGDLLTNALWILRPSSDRLQKCLTHHPPLPHHQSLEQSVHRRQ